MRKLVLATALVLAAASGAAPALAAEANPQYEIDTHDSTTQVKQGAPGKLVLVLRAKSGWHVDPRTPLKIDLTAPEGLKLEKTRLGKKDAVDPKAESPRFEAPFTAVAAGTQEARAKLDFFVCSAEACVKQVRDVTIPVTVK